MKPLLLVAIGGAVGSAARYQVSAVLLAHATGWRLPVGTLVVNVVGCLLAGVLVVWADTHHWLAPETRLLLFTGLMGGFTTFSAFGVETVRLFQQGQEGAAVANVLVSVVFGLLAVWLGMTLGYLTKV
jgi:fluoride exporter